MSSKEYTVYLFIEREGPGGSPAETELTVKGTVTPGEARRGGFSGPREGCSPGSDAEAEIDSVLLNNHPFEGDLTEEEEERAKEALLEAYGEDDSDYCGEY